MTKRSIFDMLTRLQPEINNRFRARLKGFFGSYPRGDQSDASDLDLLVDFDSFKSDDKTSGAVIRKLEIIGETAKNVPDSIKADHSCIPWKEIAGMRDKLIHSYFELITIWFGKP